MNTHTKRLTPGWPGKPSRKMNAQRFAQMVRILMGDTPMTVGQIAEAINVSNPVTNEYINALRSVRPRILRVAEWENVRTEENPLWVTAYLFGSAPDARRPPKLSGPERHRLWRQRKKLRALQATLGGMQR